MTELGEMDTCTHQVRFRVTEFEELNSILNFQTVLGKAIKPVLYQPINLVLHHTFF